MEKMNPQNIFFVWRTKEKPKKNMWRRWILIILEWIIRRWLENDANFRRKSFARDFNCLSPVSVSVLFSPRDLISLPCESSNGSRCKRNEKRWTFLQKCETIECGARNTRRDAENFSFDSVTSRPVSPFSDISHSLPHASFALATESGWGKSYNWRIVIRLEFRECAATKQCQDENWKAIELVLFLNTAMLLRFHRWAFLLLFKAEKECCLNSWWMEQCENLLSAHWKKIKRTIDDLIATEINRQRPFTLENLFRLESPIKMSLYEQFHE